MDIKGKINTQTSLLLSKYYTEQKIVFTLNSVHNNLY